MAAPAAQAQWRGPGWRGPHYAPHPAYHHGGGVVAPVIGGTLLGLGVGAAIAGALAPPPVVVAPPPPVVYAPPPPAYYYGPPPSYAPGW